MELTDQDEIITAYGFYLQGIQTSQNRLRPQFEQLMLTMAGPRGRELLARFDAEPTAWAASTGQLQHTVQQLVHEKMAVDGVVHLSDLFPILAPIARDTLDMNRQFVSAVPVGLAVVNLVDEAWEDLSSAEWVGILQYSNTLAPLQGATIAAMLAPGTSFEVVVSSIASQIARVAETNYKGLLRSILLITRLLDRGPQKIANMKPPTNTLGKLLKECHDVWKKSRPDLLPLLSSDAATIRNAEAHVSTNINFEDGTVTFDDAHEHGSHASGPYTVQGLAEFSFALQGLTMATWAALNLKELEHQYDLLKVFALDQKRIVARQ